MRLVVVAIGISFLFGSPTAFGRDLFTLKTQLAEKKPGTKPNPGPAGQINPVCCTPDRTVNLAQVRMLKEQLQFHQAQVRQAKAAIRPKCCTWDHFITISEAKSRMRFHQDQAVLTQASIRQLKHETTLYAGR